jgi:aspartyl protease family protein
MNYLLPNNCFTNPVRLLILSVSIFAIINFCGCSGCSRSGVGSRIQSRPKSSSPIAVTDRNSGTNIVKMEKQNGVYEIPVEINGVPMYFIFDTGAGLISISVTEATSLYRQGKLTMDDIVGTADFTDANGDVSEGTVINLKEVKIGNKVLCDVKASVAGNLNAPLLIGQSALEKFGKISIDYQKNEITFE